MALAPIALFTFNRPEHTLATLESLMNNRLASESELFIYSDGPKSDAPQEIISKISEVRKVIKSHDWCGKNNIIEYPKNIGLEKSITDAVNDLTTRFGKVIVLEDDLQLSPGFLNFINESLDLYENDEKVMHISGYFYPVDVQLPDSIFFNYTTSWGWATWKRAWEKYNPDGKFLRSELRRTGKYDYFNLDGVTDIALNLDMIISGRFRTWDLKWQATVVLNDGLCLHPRQSLLQNIGFDNTGIHCDGNNDYYIPLLAREISVHRNELVESADARKAVKEFFIRIRKSKLKLFLYKNYTHSSIVRILFRIFILYKDIMKKLRKK
jgi:hypothetical protein